MAAATSPDPLVRDLVAAALYRLPTAGPAARAAEVATSTRDRQLVAVASAHLRGDDDQALLLARDHLADHPDDVLVASIAALATRH